MGGTIGESPAPARYRFGDIVVDEAAHTLVRAGEPLAIEPKAFLVLLALLRRPGELIGRDELLDLVWGHRHVTPGVLTRAIAQLRGLLGDDPHRPRYIQTRHALGYRFIGQLLPPDDVPGDPQATDESDACAPGGPVAPSDPEAGREVPEATPVEAEAPPPGVARSHRWRMRHWLLASAAAVCIAVVAIWHERQAVPASAGASIAVMPFTNLGGDPRQDYFAEGLALEMHDALAGVEGLKVAAQLSPAAAATREADVRVLGRRLGVAHVLDASVRREGGRVRINARLSETASGYTVWSRRYDRALSDVFAIQSEIASDVAQSLGSTVRARQALEARLRPTRSVVAFDAYLRGLQRFRSRREEADAAAAIGLFRAALDEDAGMVAARLAICRAEAWRFEALRNAPALDAATQACAAAERLAPGDPAVQLQLGDLARLRGDPAAARQHYDAAAHAPSLRADVHLRNGMLREQEGDMDGALRAYEAALTARPADASILARIGYQRFLRGQLPLAIEAYRTAAGLTHDDERLWSSLAGLYINAGRDADAAAALQRSLSIRPGREAYLNYGVVEYHAGHYSRAAVLLRKALAEDDGDFMVWGALADALRASGSDEATAAYQRARTMATAYVAKAGDDAKARAALGWYHAALGQADVARERALQAEALGSESGEVALINAQTFSLIGGAEDVDRRVAAALAAGVPQRRVRSNPHIRHRAGAAGATVPREETADRR